MGAFRCGIGRLRFVLGLSLALAGPARAFEIPDFELVYTQPVETSLKAKDLRPPRLVWLQLIRSAQKTIDLEQMYAVSEPGEPLEGVIDALEEVGRRGVKIRFLLEKKMLRASDPPTIERLKRLPGIEFQATDFAKLVGHDGIIHAKFMVVDGARAYVGSQNFDWRSLKHVHELGVKIEDPTIAGQMQAIFDHDWDNQRRLSEGKEPREFAPPEKEPVCDSEGPVRLVASPPGHLPPCVGSSEEALVRLLGSAKSEIRAQVMSYAPLAHKKHPYRVIDDAIRAAAARGVNVRLLIANWSTDKPAIDLLKDLAKVPHVQIRVVTIPQAKQGFIPYARVIHSKYCVVDGKTAWVGTSNWEGGYLDQSRNLELVIRDGKFAERVRQLHDQLWESIYAEDLDQEKVYPKVKRE